MLGLPGFSRRGFLGSTLLAGAASPTLAAAKPASMSIALVPRPTRVIKAADRSHENTESWIFSLMVQTAVDGALTPQSMTITLLRNGAVVRTTGYPAAGFAALTYQTSYRPLLADGSAPPSQIFWPLAIRLRHTEPVALAVDAMRVDVAVTNAQGQSGQASLVLPVESYRQKTALIFPFKGKGIVLQGGAANGGHRNRSGSFALDACGLDDAWSVCAPGDGKKNGDYPGWGRALIAPAAGTVVHARSDRPDQPVADTSDPTYYAPEFQKLGGGDPGNHLVIDHGAGEFSMIAHFMAGSMLVKAGERVTQGQTLGKLGHSGDTDTPHVHYQLQAGPDWQNADALPVAFTNVDQKFMDRGTYFTAS